MTPLLMVSYRASEKIFCPKGALIFIRLDRSEREKATGITALCQGPFDWRPVKAGGKPGIHFGKKHFFRGPYFFLSAIRFETEYILHQYPDNLLTNRRQTASLESAKYLKLKRIFSLLIYKTYLFIIWYQCFGIYICIKRWYGFHLKNILILSFKPMVYP